VLFKNECFIYHAVHTFATCDFNFRMRKYAPCGPRLSVDYFSFIYEYKINSGHIFIST